MLRSCHKQCEDLTTQLEELGTIVKEHFFDHVSKVLRERLDNVVNENTFAMRNADTDRIGAVTLHAHVTSMRFAHLVTSMYTVMSATKNDVVIKSIQDGMQKLCDSTRTLLGRLSESHSKRHERAVFLVNNIDKILTVFREGDVRLSWMKTMQELMEKQIHNYVDSLLLSKFGALMTKFGGSGSSGLSSGDDKKKKAKSAQVSSVSDSELQRYVFQLCVCVCVFLNHNSLTTHKLTVSLRISRKHIKVRSNSSTQSSSRVFKMPH